MSLNTNIHLKQTSLNGSSTGIGTFRALAAFTGAGVGADLLAFQDRESCDSCVSGTQIRISAKDVLEGLTEEARAASKVLAERGQRSMLSQEQVSVGSMVDAFEHPRCNCHGDRALAERWKKQAGKDLGAFLENMFGKRPENMTKALRITMRKNCAPYIPSDKLAMLNNVSGKPSHSFWDEFSGKLQHVKPTKSGLYTDADALELIKSRFRRSSGVRSVSALELTPLERLRLRNSPEFTRHLSDKILEQLGITNTSRKRKLSITPSMTLAEAEAFLVQTIRTLTRDPQSGKLQSTGANKSRAWRYIVSKYKDQLPQAFLDEYSDELAIKKPGRPKSAATKKAVKETKAVPKIYKSPGKVVVPKTRGEQQKERLKRRDAKLRKEGIEPRKKVYVQTKPHIEDPIDALLDDESQKQAQKHVSEGLITDPDRLRRRINNMSQQIDDKFLFGTPFEKYTDLQWALMDSIRDSIAPELFNRFRAQVEGVRAKRNRATGGAYSSIIGNPQLALAHITTAWYCGEL